MNWVFLQAKFHPELDSEDSTEEEARRKALFAKTHEMIKKHNSDPKGKPQMAHNHISAMVFIQSKICSCGDSNFNSSHLPLCR